MKTQNPMIETNPVKLSDARQAVTSQVDFNQLVDLLSIYSEAENRLTQLQAAINEAALEIVAGHKKLYAGLQKTLTETETALEVIARRHPDWFAARRTLKTPYGEVALKANPPRLIAGNEELSIVLLETEGAKNKSFKPADYLRQRTELNLETLANLTDDDLARFRIKRVQGDTFSIKPARLDLGKAVKGNAVDATRGAGDASRN
jgi:hypothetical protein